MTLLRLCTTLAVLFTTAQAVTPIEKVIKLLEDLKADVESEGKAEAASYEKFACFCKDTTGSKSKSIEEGQDKIDTTTADIGKKTATRKEKISDLGKEQDKLEETNKELAAETEQYQKDKAAYDEENADLTKAVNSAKRAHKALSGSKGASFLDLGTKSDIRICLDLADAMGMVQAPKREAVTSFLQVDPNDAAYKFHSDKILGIIADLQKDFQDQKDKVNDEWQKTDKAYKAAKSDLEGKIDTCEKEIKKLNGEIDKLKADIAKLNEDLVLAESTLQDDSQYLKDLTARCEEKANAWDQRSSLRHDEVEALKKATETLKKGAADADEVNKRALLLAKKPAAPVAKVAPVKAEAKAAVKAPVKLAVKAPVKAAAKAPVKAAEKAQVKPSFLQVGAKSRTQKAQDRTVAFLQHESIRLDSTMLQSVADQIRADPFVKIKKLIQGLIERLLTESKQEATKKGFCDTELGKSYSDRDSRLQESNKLDSDLAELTAHKDALELEISELTDDLKKLRDDLKKATDLRKDEKAENESTIQKAQDGAKAVGEALTILADFYKSAAKASLLQVSASASPVDEDDPGAGFDSPYRGGQSSSKGILGLLEVIKSDYERTHRKTEAAEKKALEEFVLFERSSKSDIGSKDTKKALDEQDLESTKSAIDQGMKDFQTTFKLLDAALKNIEDLRPTCIDTGMSYKERVAKREEEIKALGEALCKLDPEKVEADCQAR